MAKKKTKKVSVAKALRVSTSGKFRLNKFDPDETFGIKDKESAAAELAKIHERLDELQEMLFAGEEHGVLVVLQAMDAGGKDSTIRRVFGPLNPQGVQVIPFKAPTSEELAHDFLWRIHKKTPPKGMIHIFNRSHYEDVLIVKVHEWASEKTIASRYDQINQFEKHLADSGVTVIKFYLNISRDEQKERFQERLDRPDKHWKFNIGDLKERALWKDYMGAFETALKKCSTGHAPWYVIPSNKKWARDVIIGRIVLQTLEKLKLKYPEQGQDISGIIIPD